MKYKVTRKYTYTDFVLVEADNEAEAEEIAIYIDDEELITRVYDDELDECTIEKHEEKDNQ